MKNKYSFIQINSDFSQEHADAHFEGNESENNVKYLWEDALEITGEAVLNDVGVGTYTLQGATDKGSFSYDIQNVHLENYSSDQGNTQIAVSESLILEKIEEEDENGKKVTFLLTDQDVIINPIPGVYIAVDDFPNELK